MEADEARYALKKEFQNIILDIPDTSLAEQLDCYIWGLKLNTWNEMHISESGSLSEEMPSSERLEVAHWRNSTQN